MASSFLGFNVDNLICGEGGERSEASAFACAQEPMSHEGLFPGEGVLQDGGEEGIVFSDDESEEEGLEESFDVLLRWGMVHGDDEEKPRRATPFKEERGGTEVAVPNEVASAFVKNDDDLTDEEGEGEEESRRLRRRPVDKAWPRVRTSDNRNWARDATTGSPIPRLIYVHEDRLRLCFLLQDAQARAVMQSARRQFEKLAKDLASCTKTSAFKKNDFVTKSVYFLPESSWHISCATLITRTTMDVWPSAQGAIALLEDMLNCLKAPTIKYTNGGCRVCDDGAMVVVLDDGGWTAEFRRKLEASGLGKGKGSTREGIPHMRLAPRHGETSHATSCVALVGRLFVPEHLSEKELGKMRKVLKAFRTRQTSTHGSQRVVNRHSSLRPGGSAVNSRGWRSASQQPPAAIASAVGTGAASDEASGGGPVTSASDSSPVPPDERIETAQTQAQLRPPRPRPAAFTSHLNRRSSTGRSRSMVPFNFKSGRSRQNGLSATGHSSTVTGSDAGVGRDLELSVLSMVREQQWCMGKFILEGEFELESN